MRYLFDINVLIALLDERHPAHNLCMAWYGTQQGGTALCPLVENGAARTMASTAYAQDQLALRPGRLLLQIARMKQSADDMARFDHSKIHGPAPVDRRLFARAGGVPRRRPGHPGPQHPLGCGGGSSKNTIAGFVAAPG